ncbi:MAG: gluconeogenesis factor YvcK family protein [Bacilli bacterium]
MTMKERPSVVVIGGGTGLPVLLRGLKSHDVDLSAIVTVADDGGSTGMLRDQMDLPAVGDLRKVIAAMSEAEPILMEMFQHRFETRSELNGHSLGNLILAGLCSITGSFNHGVQEMCRVLNVSGSVLPVANHSVVLHAQMSDGQVISGESQIPKANKKIERVWLTPEHVPPNPEAIEHILEADLLVIAPGSLYTSIIPNLVVEGVAAAVCQSRAKKVYVCNVMTQAGETNGYSVSDHIAAIHQHVGAPFLHYVVANNGLIPSHVLRKYNEEHAVPVRIDERNIRKMGVELIAKNVINVFDGSIRHNKKSLAKTVLDLLQ